MVFGKVSSDLMLGICGCVLAAGSASFGIFMTMNGPVHGLFRNSHEFTVFAQFSPPEKHRPARPPDGRPTGDLDMTATAAIPKPSTAPDRRKKDSDEIDVLPSVVLRSVLNAEAAVISIEGRTRTIKPGDELPGLGEVLEIRAGEHPSVRTTRGLVLAVGAGQR